MHTQSRTIRDGSPDLPVTVVGGGHVGLVVAVCMAEQGLQVRLIEADVARQQMIAGGTPPLYEPDLEPLLRQTLDTGTLTVDGDLAAAAAAGGIIFIAVGTPENSDGSTDLRALTAAATTVAQHAGQNTVIVIKSTVPPGTTERLSRILGGLSPNVSLVMCPEFLREGNALHDYRCPPRVVLGGDDPAVLERVAAIAVPTPDTLVLRSDATSAELVKYSSNAFLATKISFINEVARLCDLVGADIDLVARGVGADPRIGPDFLHAGLGFGGSCFPKDVRSLAHTAGYLGQSFWTLNAAIEVNAQQRRLFIRMISEAFDNHLEGRRIAVAGLAYKPGTDDMRHAPALEIITNLAGAGAQVVATDPEALAMAHTLLPDVELADTLQDAARGADAVALVTEWEVFRAADWGSIGDGMRRRLVFDGRNCLDVRDMRNAGFEYHGIGRPMAMASGAMADR